MKEVVEYLKAVCRHWLLLLIGIGGAALTWWGVVSGPIPPVLGVVIGLLLVSVAQFLAWRDQARKVQELELEQLDRPGVQVTGGLAVVQSKAFTPKGDASGASGLLVRLRTEQTVSRLRLAADRPVGHRKVQASGPGEVSRPPSEWDLADPVAPVGFFRPPVGPGCQIDIQVAAPAGIERLRIEAAEQEE